MKVTLTPHGKIVYGSFKDAERNEVRVQETSSAGARKVWLITDPPEGVPKFVRFMPGDGWIPITGLVNSTIPLLTVAQANRLIEALQNFVRGVEP